MYRCAYHDMAIEVNNTCRSWFTPTIIGVQAHASQYFFPVSHLSGPHWKIFSCVWNLHKLVFQFDKESAYLFYFLEKIKGFATYPRLALNSLCSTGCP